MGTWPRRSASDLLDRFSSANVELHARVVLAAASKITAALRQRALAA